MLGWEYPPRFAGGLGKACQGLSQAMAKLGSQVFFVLPTFPERKIEQRLEVVGAREVLIEAGWDPATATPPAGSAAHQAFQAAQQQQPGQELPPSITQGRVTTIKSDAKLYPYGVAPSGPVPERILKMISRMTEAEALAPGERRKIWKLSREEVVEHRQVLQQPPSNEIYGRNLWSEIEKFCFTVRHLAESHDVDVIHAHDWMTFPAAFEFQRMTGVPVFLHVHATEYDRSGESLDNDIFRIEREGFRRATHIFAVSNYTAGIIERLYGVHRKKISVVYNAPDEDVRNAHPEETDIAGEKRKPQVVFLGRLTFQKGPDHFLRAAQLVAKANTTARFIICGTGDMMDKLRHQTHRLGIEQQVHFAGFVDPSGVDQILKQSRVLVMPSVSEPFGLVALEAIKCGIPVIISKQSGVREVLPRALQVDFWDHEKLADQINASLRFSDLSKQLVTEGMEQIQQLGWDKSAQKVLDTYQQHLGSTYFEAVEGAHGH